MSDSNLFQTLGQVSGGEAAIVFRDHIRGYVRTMISEVMAAEVEHLCGPKHQPNDSVLYRAGNSLGRVLVDGEREEVMRPRVRQQQPNGST
ncbi:MAG: IS256 family transposase, partial [Pirellulales bacterium]